MATGSSLGDAPANSQWQEGNALDTTMTSEVDRDNTQHPMHGQGSNDTNISQSSNDAHMWNQSGNYGSSDQSAIGNDINQSNNLIPQSVPVAGFEFMRARRACEDQGFSDELSHGEFKPIDSFPIGHWEGPMGMQESTQYREPMKKEGGYQHKKFKGRRYEHKKFNCKIQQLKRELNQQHEKAAQYLKNTKDRQGGYDQTGPWGYQEFWYGGYKFTKNDSPPPSVHGECISILNQIDLHDDDDLA